MDLAQHFFLHATHVQRGSIDTEYFSFLPGLALPHVGHGGYKHLSHRPLPWLFFLASFVIGAASPHCMQAVPMQASQVQMGRTVTEYGSLLWGLAFLQDGHGG